MNEPAKRSSSCFSRFLFVFFILPGLCLGLYGTAMAIVAQWWTPVEATVEKVYTDARLTSRPRSTNTKQRSRKKYTVRRLKIEYIYEWEGDTIRSDRVAFLQGFSRRSISKTIKGKIIKGGKVRAYVNPWQPEKAVLVRAIHNTIAFGYVSALSCFLFFGAISGLLFKYPSTRFGWISLSLMIILYIIYFGIGINLSIERFITVIS